MVISATVTAIIQARTGSKRFPNKVFAELCDKPIIWHIVNRLRYCRKLGSIVLATTNGVSDDRLEVWGRDNHLIVCRGSENDVLDRFYHAALVSHAETVLRITADDPFKDPVIIDNVIEVLLKNDLDFAYNNNPPTFPEGLDVEVFSFRALELAQKESRDEFEREHVTQFMYRHPERVKQANVPHSEDLSSIRLTVDTEEDLEMATQVYEKLYRPGQIFVLEDIVNLLKQEPWISDINMKVARSAIYTRVGKDKRR